MSREIPLQMRHEIRPTGIHHVKFVVPLRTVSEAGLHEADHRAAVAGLQVEVDESFSQTHKYSKWKLPRSVRSKAAKKPVSRKRQIGAVGSRVASPRNAKR